MTLTYQSSDTVQRRRPVAGYILASIIVGVIGLVTAIMMTVSGIMNSFSSVGESYVDIFETGQEIGTQPVDVTLDSARYTIVSFADAGQEGASLQAQGQCVVADQDGDYVATEASAQRVSATEQRRIPRSEPTEFVVFTHFEARSGAHRIVCAHDSLLSNGASHRLGSTSTYGLFIALGSIVIAGGLFGLGVVNSSRNKASQAQRLARA